MHWSIVAAKFAQLLPTPATWRTWAANWPHHQNFDDVLVTSHHHCGDGTRLGASAFRIGRVLDVASGEYLAALGANCRTHVIAGVRRVGVVAGISGGLHQIVQSVSTLLGIGNTTRLRSKCAANKAGEQNNSKQVGQRLNKLHRNGTNPGNLNALQSRGDGVEKSEQ